MAANKVMYHFVWPNPAANRLRWMARTAFLSSAALLLGFWHAGYLSLSNAAQLVLLLYCIHFLTSALVEAGQWAFGAGATVTPTALLVKRHLHERAYPWKDIEAVTLGSQRRNVADTVFVPYLFYGPKARTPYVTVRLSRQSVRGAPSEEIKLFLRDSEAFARDARQYLRSADGPQQ